MQGRKQLLFGGPGEGGTIGICCFTYFWRFQIVFGGVSPTLLRVCIYFYIFSLVNVLVYSIRDRRFRKNAVDFLLPRSLKKAESRKKPQHVLSQTQPA